MISMAYIIFIYGLKGVEPLGIFVDESAVGIWRWKELIQSFLVCFYICFDNGADLKSLS